MLAYSALVGAFSAIVKLQLREGSVPALDDNAASAGVQDPDQLILQKQNFLAQLQGKDEQLVVNKKKLVRAQRKKYATQQVGGDWWTAVT